MASEMIRQSSTFSENFRAKRAESIDRSEIRASYAAMHVSNFSCARRRQSKVSFALLLVSGAVQCSHEAPWLEPFVPREDDGVKHGFAHKEVAHPLTDDDINCMEQGRRRMCRDAGRAGSGETHVESLVTTRM